MSREPMQTPAPARSNQLPPQLMGLLIMVSISLVGIALTLLMVTSATAPETPPENNAAAVVGAGSASENTGITEVVPVEPIEDFTLTATNNEMARFSDFRGKWLLIYFGFTFCPDYCPATLLDFRQIKRDLGEDAAQIDFMMISVDGERDTPEVLDKYLALYDEDFIGLTGDADVVTPVVQQFGAQFQRRENPGSPYYTVDHTVSLFLVNPQGEWATLYAYGTDVSVIVEDLKAKIAS